LKLSHIHDLDFNLGSGHVAHTDLYLHIKFRSNLTNFSGWPDGWTNIH